MPDRIAATVVVGGPSQVFNVAFNDLTSVNLGAGPFTNFCDLDYTMSTSSTAGSATITIIGNQISVSSTNHADAGTHTLIISSLGSHGVIVDFSLTVDITSPGCTILSVTPVSPIADMTYVLGSAPIS